MKTNDELKLVCGKFRFDGRFLSAAPYGDGHINETFKLSFSKEDKEINYILQKINNYVFKDPESLMMNIKNVTEHLKKKSDNYEGLEIIPTIDDDILLCLNNEYWRSYKFIGNTTGHNLVDSMDMLFEAGKAFGSFQNSMNDFPVNKLHETIVDFHNTKKRYDRFVEVVELNPEKRVSQAKDLIDIVVSKSKYNSLILDGLLDKKIPLRVTHNDTKLNNVLIDNCTGRARCVIDLDTVMPGSLLYDFGDSIRSCGSTALEDEENLDLIKLDLEKFKAFTTGFLLSVGPLTETEKKLLVFAPIIMTYECGVRFFTDYLEGDVYFKIHKENHNLIRAKNQFEFVKEMEANIDLMDDIIRNCLEMRE